MMEKTMETIIFGDFTVMNIIIAVGVIIGLFYFWKVLKSAFKKKKVGPHAQLVICFGCGWQGPVSKYAGKCPKCNKPIGEQKAKKINK
jgi:uncharacterized membrane protein